MKEKPKVDEMKAAHGHFAASCGTEGHGMKPSYNPPGAAPSRNFISSAIKKPGALHRSLGVPMGKKIPTAKIAAAAKAPGKLGQRARFAQTLAKLRK